MLINSALNSFSFNYWENATCAVKCGYLINSS